MDVLARIYHTTLGVLVISLINACIVMVCVWGLKNSFPYLFYYLDQIRFIQAFWVCFSLKNLTVVLRASYV